jgi:protease-4
MSTGFGTPDFQFGLGYGWSAGTGEHRAKYLAFGTILRPSKYLSFGLTGNFSTENAAREAIVEIAGRPLGTAKFTAFADAAPNRQFRFSDTPWSAGAVFQITPGIDLSARYLNLNKAVTVGLNLTFGRSGLSGQGRHEEDGGYQSNSYHIRIGGYKPGRFREWFGKDRYYFRMHLNGRIDYLKYSFFDSKTIRFLDIVRNIQAAVDDPRVSVIAVNLSGLRIRPQNAWEIREALKRARNSGKKVVTFVDRNGMTGYHLASVADYVVMDPLGQLVLPGYSLGQTYLKGTLEKLGIGFDEWRFFKYKSANEIYSRENMSDAQREQLQEFVDDWYEHTRAGICESRSVSQSEFDSIINNEGFIPAAQAVKLSLVDTLARWSDISGIVQKLDGSKKPLGSNHLAANESTAQNWGTAPEIAIVYAIGVCDMDSGIRARWLENVILQLQARKSVKAVVLRVDSPGGYGIASDMVAQALRKCAKYKPVIVTMGQTAASGGYWVSMYGDSVLAGPATMTGSIGVISGWVWDQGFSARLGMSSDLVQRGKHADLWQGITLPLLNLTIPARPVTAEERQRAESIILQMYDDFVTRVAEARGIPEARVREIAEGRIYSGVAAVQNNLIDTLGGIEQAIQMAVERAGLQDEEEIAWVEYPSRKGLLNIRSQLSPIAVSGESSNVLDFIRLFAEKNGQALPVLLPGTYPGYAD